VSKFGDAFGDRENSEMHLESGIERIRRCTWQSSELRDELGGWDRTRSAMQLEADIERTQRGTERP
jgi:hypothetical protein